MRGRNATSRPPSPPRLGRQGAGQSAFTLIEMLAVMGFTAILMLFAVNFYIDISRASEAATERTRESRRAIAILDRVARDLEAAVLVEKPPEVDPLYHPWVFLAEDRRGEEGAERLKFITRSRIPRSSELHESDLEVVSYALREGVDGASELLRWSSPRLPEELDRSIPASEADGAELFADGLASFGVRFMDDTLAWKGEWDSSTLIDSSELPVAAEISVALSPLDRAPEEEEPEIYLRRVLMPVRPLDLQGSPDEDRPGDGGGCPDGPTVGACLAGDLSAIDTLRRVDPQRAAAIEEVFDECFSDHRELFAGTALEDCR